MRSLVVLAGASFAVLVLMLAGPGAPLDHIGQIPIPEVTQVQSAEAWYYEEAMCSSGFKRGDWLQHFESRRLAHRSVKLGPKYVYNGGIYVDIRKVAARYNESRTRVLSTHSRGIYSVLCGRA